MGRACPSIRCHADAVSNDRIEALLTQLRAFVRERDWEQFHDPKNLVMLLASEVGELVAEYRWVEGASADEHSSEPASRARIESEVADVTIALLLLVDRIGLDLDEIVRRKIGANAERYPADAVRGSAARPASTAPRT